MDQLDSVNIVPPPWQHRICGQNNPSSVQWQLAVPWLLPTVYDASLELSQYSSAVFAKKRLDSHCHVFFYSALQPSFSPSPSTIPTSFASNPMRCYWPVMWPTESQVALLVMLTVFLTCPCDAGYAWFSGGGGGCSQFCGYGKLCCYRLSTWSFCHARSAVELHQQWVHCNWRGPTLSATCRVCVVWVWLPIHFWTGPRSDRVSFEGTWSLTVALKWHLSLTAAYYHHHAKQFRTDIGMRRLRMSPEETWL